MIVGIVGPIASGKNVLGEMLIEKGFVLLKLSVEVKEEVKMRGLPIERASLQDIGNEMRAKNGNEYWAERVIRKMEPGKNYVVDGIRNPGEIEALRKLSDFILVDVDAPIEKRLQWIIARNHDGDPKTIEDIKAIDARDMGIGEAEHGQQTSKCQSMADVHITNDGTLNELTEKLDEFLESIKC